MSPQELRTRRQAMGLSQADLAELLDVTSATVSRWERGVLTIKHHTILDLALCRLEWLHLSFGPFVRREEWERLVWAGVTA